MHSFNMIHVIALLSAFASFTIADTNASDAPFQLTNLKIQKVGDANVTIEFTVYDPDPLTNATAVCSGSWKTGSRGYPQGSYEACGNSTFEWHMESFNTIRSFVLGIEHTYEDPSVGQPPYDEITNFGKANVTEPAIVCTAISHIHMCQQDADESIEAPIYATIAKLR